MRGRLAFLGVVCGSWVLVQACGGDAGTDLDGGGDVTVNDVNQPDNFVSDVVTNPDTGDDGSAGDASDGGTADASDGATTIDTGIAQWSCGSVKVSDCSQCTGFTQPCAYCGVQDASALTGVCVQTGTNCLNAIPNQGVEDCVCTPGDASTCPEAFQVCTTNGRCHTCTDSTQNNGLKCENATTCQADAGCK
jgi:hypothetical protein